MVRRVNVRAVTWSNSTTLMPSQMAVPDAGSSGGKVKEGRGRVVAGSVRRPPINYC
jgi:hypothetical protein